MAGRRSSAERVEHGRTHTRERPRPEDDVVIAEDRRRRQLSDLQRARILAAMVHVASEHGVGYATVARVVSHSGVSRRTFYEQFVDREDCFLAAFDQAVGRIATVVVPAYRESAEWHERVRGGLTALLRFLDLEPDLARLVIVEALGAGPEALERRRRGIAQIIAPIDQEGRESIAGDGPPPLTGEGLVGGALSLIHDRLVADERRSLVELLNPLVSMVVLPYLGTAAARRELDRPIPRNALKGVSTSGNPLKDLEMRLTYRTVCVLTAIGAHPGVSNRRIAEVAGVSDQGQISKLLARLDNLGLVENSGFGQAKGESNSWYLTKRGQQIENAIQEQTTDRR